MAMKLHSDSKFKPFSLNLADGGQVTGIQFSPTSARPSNCPLIVGIHGGSCTAQIFDVQRDYTASIYSENYGAPFVSINRLNYAGSVTYECPESFNYREEEARWNHHFALPAVWEAYGKPNGCTGIVILAHSMGCASTIITAALHAEDKSPKYPLSGIIMSGWGVEHTDYIYQHHPSKLTGPTYTFPLDVKRTIMLGEEHLDCADPEVISNMNEQHTYVLNVEMRDVPVNSATWKPFAELVSAPVMIALGEHDIFWKGTEAHVRQFASCFPNSGNVESLLVKGAPHSLELSRGTSAWWFEKCFSWAINACNRSEKVDTSKPGMEEQINSTQAGFRGIEVA